MIDPYLNTKNCINRLLKDYDAHKNLIIGFDFDDTIFDYHKEGHIYPKILNLLFKCQRMGLTLMLFTGNEGKDLDKCLSYCKELGLKVQFVNESPINKEHRKPYCNIMLDDRGGLKESYLILKETIKRIKEK